MQLPQSSLRVGSDLVASIAVVRNFGIFIDADISTRSHVTRMYHHASLFCVNYTVYSTYSAANRFSVAGVGTLIVLSRLDYGINNATLAGIPDHLVQRLQSVMNAAARMIYSMSRYDHITPFLHQLHWPIARERIDYKLAVLVYKYACTGLVQLVSLMSSVIRLILRTIADFVQRLRSI